MGGQYIDGQYLETDVPPRPSLRGKAQLGDESYFDVDSSQATQRPAVDNYVDGEYLEPALGPAKVPNASEHYFDVDSSQEVNCNLGLSFTDAYFAQAQPKLPATYIDAQYLDATTEYPKITRAEALARLENGKKAHVCC